MLFAIVITIALGVAMGAINNLAGGAGVLGLLAFEWLWGLPLGEANPSTRVSAVAIGAFAALGFLRAGHRIPGRAWLQGLAAVPGALVGSQLATSLPDLAFRGYLAAVLVMLLVQQLRRRNDQEEDTQRPRWLAFLGCFFIGMHMGYVQVGTGLVATFVLVGAYRRDLVAVLAAKSAVVILTSVTSAAVFVFEDAIEWPPALALAAGCALGSYLASHWGVKKGADAIRRVVIVIAALCLADQLRHIALALTSN
ncbi:MAG: sulfite exporter TauE/SafE family protein [bacterium]|nr:sulfite exporter TauE/SafE family protein [bacterium]